MALFTQVCPLKATDDFIFKAENSCKKVRLNFNLIWYYSFERSYQVHTKILNSNLGSFRFSQGKLLNTKVPSYGKYTDLVSQTFLLLECLISRIENR